MKRNQPAFEALAGLYPTNERATRAVIMALLGTLDRAVATGNPGRETEALLAILRDVADGGSPLIDAAMTRADLVDLPADTPAASAREAVVTAASAAMVGLGMVASSSMSLPEIAAYAAEAAAAVSYMAAGFSIDKHADEERRQIAEIIAAAHLSR